jgi:Zn-dependent M16 (insulinase) family peptidase
MRCSTSCTTLFTPPRLDNRDRIRQIVREERALREASLIPSGHTAVNTRLRARFNEADWAAEQIGGVSYLLFLRRVEQAIDEEWDTVRTALERMRTLLVDRSALLVNVTVDAAGWTGSAPVSKHFLTGCPPANLRWQRGTRSPAHHQKG